MRSPLLSADHLLGLNAGLLREEGVLFDAVVTHGDVARLPFLQIEAIRDVRAVLAAWDGVPRSARAWSPPSGPLFQLSPSVGQLHDLYEAGYTIILEDVERFVPELKPFCRSLERDLGVQPGKVNVEVFCAREGGRGRAHFDPSFTFNCQISGTKSWRTMRSASVVHPTFGLFVEQMPPLEYVPQLGGELPDTLEETVEFTANPGSVVFLPPGVLWAAAGFKDTLLRWKMKPEVVHGNRNETAVQPGVQA